MRYDVLSARSWPLVSLFALLAACSDSTDSPDVDAGLDGGVTPGFDARVDPGSDAGLDGAVLPLLDAGNDATTNVPDSGLGGDASTDSAVVDATLSVPLVCTVMAPTSCPDPAPTYADVAAIIDLRCESCHSPRWTGPWPLDTYRHVADWQDSVRAHMLDCTMPPPESGLPMANEERMVILNWLRCGLPR